MNQGLRNVLQVLSVATASSAVLALGAHQAFAGSVNVITTGDSSAAGAVNFDANAGSNAGVNVQTLSTAGGEITVNIAGVIATATSPATAVNAGTLTQAQADTGLGSGGAVISFASNPQAIAAITAAANATTGAGTVGGAGLQGATSPAAALIALAADANVANVTVVMPTGTSVSLGQTLSNLSAAIASGDPIALPTALNDAAIALRAALQAPGAAGNPALQTAARSVAALLQAARASGDTAAAEGTN